MIALVLYLIFLSILATIIVFILRQAVSYFVSVKYLFAATFGLYWVVIFLDVIRYLMTSPELILPFTTRVGISYALVNTIALEYLALKLCRGEHWKNLGNSSSSARMNLVSILYRSYVILLLLITWIFAPWKIQQMQNAWGSFVYNQQYETWYLAALTILAVAFIGYPCALLLQAGRKSKQEKLASVLKWFGVGWMGIAFTLIMFHGILRTLNIELIELSHLFNLAFFGIIAYTFRRTSLLENLFERLHTPTYLSHPTSYVIKSKAFSKALGLTHGQVVGKTILLGFDPTCHYERVVEDFVEEALANGESVAVFTSKGSTIYNALSNKSDVNFLVLTQRVSTPQADSSKNKILLPANNSSLLLDALNKVLKTHPEKKPSIIFDSLSSLYLFIGFDKTYGFLRYAIELLAMENGTALFLFNREAHDAQVTSALISLFSNQVTYGKNGLQVVKIPEPALKA